MLNVLYELLLRSYRMSEEVQCFTRVHHLCNFNMSVSYICNDSAKSIDRGELSKWNYIWVVPLNLAGSVGGILYAPLAAVVHLLAYAIFNIIECCVDDPRDKVMNRMMANTLLGGAVSSLTDNIVTLFARIFVPATNELTYLGPTVTAKLIACQIESYGNGIHVPPELTSYENVAQIVSIGRAFIECIEENESRITELMQHPAVGPLLRDVIQHPEDPSSIRRLLQHPMVMSTIREVTRTALGDSQNVDISSLFLPQSPERDFLPGRRPSVEEQEGSQYERARRSDRRPSVEPQQSSQSPLDHPTWGRGRSLMG
jgi:hypothetical protein